MQPTDFIGAVEQILQKDTRYGRDAYVFVREALDHTQELIAKDEKKKSHVSGQELLEGIKDCALRQFGPMTMTVFDEWGIRSCEDFGEMVFNMVDVKLLSKTETDSREDFKGGYDFQEAFVLPFRPVVKKPADEPKSSQPDDEVAGR
jgi:uncharacterized repeat protein (TIGR04138 family)